MRVRLAYGKSGLDIDVPDKAAVVVKPRHQPPAPDPMAELRRALRQPVAGPTLREIVRPRQTMAISVCDITRPQPRSLMLQAILEEIEGVIAPGDVTILIATGTHRGSTDAEIDDMLGPGIRSLCQVVDHDSRDRGSLVDLGWVDDVPLLLNRAWIEADLRITTGFVEPHFFAGFSGGPKMIAPGLAGLRSVLALHNARRIGDPRATWGVCEGNPVHDAIRKVAARTGADYSLDVLLNTGQRITRAFGGQLFEMHAEARRVAREEAMCPLDEPFDVVLTTNGGYPLDRNLYQSVKGMSAAAAVVKEGGTIICAAECRDGLPDGDGYASLLSRAATMADLLQQIETSPVTVPDQWQVQIQARVQAHARVLVYSDGLTSAQLAAAHLEAAEDVERALVQSLEGNPAAAICVLPQGPQTIAYIA